MRIELARKVGPLPLGGWLAIAAVGVAAAIIIQRRRAAANAAAASAEPSVVGPDGERLDATAVASYTPGGFVVGGGGTQATGNTNGADDSFMGPAIPDPKTNSDWARAANNYLIGRGYEPSIVIDGVSRFLGGSVLTTQQQAMINDALQNVGPPPENVPPPAVTPVPVPTGSGGGGGTITKPAPPAATGTSVIARTSNGTELYGMITQVWGRPPTRTEWRSVARSNGLTTYRPNPARDFESVKPWTAGTSIRIPPRP